MSDGNAFSLGGVAGHAGVFADVGPLHALLGQLLFAPAAPGTRAGIGVNDTTARLFTRVANASFSSRALGWDTNAPGSYRGCGRMSAATFTHTGYTGTQICADPERELVTVLLTNRVYPRASNESIAAIHTARARFNRAVREVVDG